MAMCRCLAFPLALPLLDTNAAKVERECQGRGRSRTFAKSPSSAVALPGFPQHGRLRGWGAWSRCSRAAGCMAGRLPPSTRLRG